MITNKKCGVILERDRKPSGAETAQKLLNDRIKREQAPAPQIKHREAGWNCARDASLPADMRTWQNGNARALGSRIID